MTTLIVGLARSGLAAGRLLAWEGEDIVGCDAGTPELDDPGFPVELGTDGVHLLDRVDQVVKSPGVPPHAPVVEEARRRGIPVIGELELAWRRLHGEHRFVAVTGTNGKTTVTKWLGHVLQLAGRSVALAGNVGTPLSTLVGELPDDTLIVCECSSFQLQDAATFAPDVGVLLNLGSDHVNWHRSEDAYRAAKLSMFARQRPDQLALVPAAISPPGQARRLPLSEADTTLPGRHNRENAGAVAAVCRVLGVPEDIIAEGLRTFAGVEHRLEVAADRDGVRWVNDSKATNVASTLVALDAFAGDRVHLIVGGDDAKAEDFSPLRPGAERAAGVYLIGAAEGRLLDALGRGIPCGTLDAAVDEARRLAERGDVVLLSPACASYDQFRDYEHRGRRFKELVG